MLVAATPSYALPTGADLVSGSATVSGTSSQLTISQTTDRAILNWRSFDIGVGEHVLFIQPSSHSVALNRITGSQNPSQILGSLSANGTVMLVNPNGVVFGAGAQVDVGSMVATTSDIAGDRFMNGDYRFDIPGRPDAAIINQGSITVADAGLAAFVAPNVANEGLIRAKLGKVQLASGDAFTLDLYGDGLVSLEAGPDITSQIVSNSGIISADGGKVLLTTAAANDVVNSLINMDGIIQANSIGEQDGEIVIFAEGGNAVAGNDPAKKGQKQGIATVLVSGVLDTSGYGSGESGGTVAVLGDHIGLLAGTLVNASGDQGGGTVLIGGDYLGKGTTPTARETYVAKNTLILNDAMTQGDGGKTIVWADDTTWFYGNILGRGGMNGGNGGFVETSGKVNLVALGFVDLRPQNTTGHKGTYLLDPDSITIVGNATSVFNSADLVAGYNFDEGAGTNANDSTANNNDGTLTNGPTWSGSGAPTPQVNGNSLTFDGSDDYVDVGTSPAFDMSSEVTISFWLNAANLVQTGSLVSMWTGAPATNSYAVLLDANNRISFVLTQSDDTVLSRNGAATLSSNTWYHIVALADGDNLTAYINGVIDAAPVAYDGTINAASTNLLIGKLRTSDSVYAYNGLIDDVRIYDAALSGNDISELYGSRFTVAGIEAMSATADVSLLATNDITMDLGGDTLDMTSGRNLTLTATSGDILSASAGTINAADTGSILLSSGDDINIAHDLDLNATGSGSVTLRASNSIIYSGSGDITTQGGAITLNSDRDASGAGAISLGSGTTLTSNSGNITLGGGNDPTAIAAYGTASHVAGINLNAAILTSGSSNIRMTGTGYTGGVDTSSAYGIIMQAGAQANATGSGTVTLTGIGGGSGTGALNSGILMMDANTRTRVVNGNLVLSGTTGTTNSAGAAFAGTASGVYVTNGAVVETIGTGDVALTGISVEGPSYITNGVTIGDSNGGTVRSTAVGGGDITIIGYNNAGSNVYGAAGVLLTNGSDINSIDGHIVINGNTGLGGQAVTNTTANNNVGVRSSQGTISTSGTGNITINGLGGGSASSNGNVGVYFLDDFGSLFTASGNIHITGTGSASTGGGNYGILLANPSYGGSYLSHLYSDTGNITLTGIGGDGDTGIHSSVDGNHTGYIGGATTDGNITFVADTIDLANHVIQTTGTVTLQPYSKNGTIGVAGGPGTLQLTQAAIDSIAAGSITIGRNDGSGMMTVGAATWNDPLTLMTSNGGITFTGAQTLGTNSLLARTYGASDITLNDTITSTATGTAITLVSGRNFINNAGSGVLSTPSGRWLVYSTNPASDTIGGLSNDFRRFSCTYAGSCPSFPGSGNGFLYSYTPTLTATPSALSITYGDAAPNLSGYVYILSGYLGSDSGSDSVTGSLTGSSAYAQGSGVGSYNVDYSSGALASSLGYDFSYANSATGIAVNPKSLTASLVGVVRKTFDGTTAATLASSNYSLSGVLFADAVSLNYPLSGMFDTANVGAGKSVSVNGLALLGADASNYSLAATSISSAVGQIDANISTSDTARILFPAGRFQPSVSAFSDVQFLPSRSDGPPAIANAEDSPTGLSPAAGKKHLTNSTGKPPFIAVDPRLQLTLGLPSQL